MTYTLIELVKDNLDTWFTEVSKHQPKTLRTSDRVLSTATEEMNNLVRGCFVMNVHSRKEDE